MESIAPITPESEIQPEQVEEWIRDYQWMTNEIYRLREELGHVGIGIGSYGIEAGLPIGTDISNKTLREAIKRDRRIKNLIRFEKITQKIDHSLESLKNYKEISIVECLMDGINHTAIARHIGVSRSKYYTMKQTVMEKLIANWS